MTSVQPRRRFLRSAATLLAGGVAGGWLSNRLAATQTGTPAFPGGAQPLAAARTIITPAGYRVHAIQTGFVAVKTAHRELRGAAEARIPAIVLDRQWTPWLPIMVWVIEHPEGVIVIDTGETSRTAEPGYFDCDPGTNLVYTTQLRFAVGPADDLAPQLATLGIQPRDVRWVVQTHLHSDHVGGLGALSGAQVLLPQADYPVSQGTLPCRMPAALTPQFPAFSASTLPGFSQSMPLTTDGAVQVVPTPGHSPGHQSVLLRAGPLNYLFAGDTSFDADQLRSGAIAGIVADPVQAAATLTAIRGLCAAQPTVYLPTHDPASGERFSTAQTTV
jgi:N-acyl homoserine lactone hydrolase